MADVARREDARRPDGPALRQRSAGREDARQPPPRRAGLLPRPARSPRPRGGGQADAGLRRDGLLPPRRPRGSGPPHGPADPGLHPRPNPRPGGPADPAPRRGSATQPTPRPPLAP